MARRKAFGRNDGGGARPPRSITVSVWTGTWTRHHSWAGR
ncbi:hypothetical protein ppKF707_5495 [Metapseudomonas furukawaii]|uniref:Uncharacterized protein n=1 Tax=Metapseudomonas furukawaii TaxID=1149133 RepID=A0AAD1FDC1_METFU|nr:hypothetical protein ppKF707_5495 [Pseudomonas furukawaii]BAU71729.1 hypothetical protein KF707C_410 [Pseudomonas furukawaii]